MVRQYHPHTVSYDSFFPPVRSLVMVFPALHALLTLSSHSNRLIFCPSICHLNENLCSWTTQEVLLPFRIWRFIDDVRQLLKHLLPPCPIPVF